MSLLKPLDEMFAIRCAGKLAPGQSAPVMVQGEDGKMVAEPGPVAWKLSLDENLPQKVFADNDRLRQVLTNLCDNAVKVSRIAAMQRNKARERCSRVQSAADSVVLGGSPGSCC